MKKFVKISVVFLVLLLCIYNTCFADLIDPAQRHNGYSNGYTSDAEETQTAKIIILSVYFVALGIYIVRCIIRNKKLKDNPNNNENAKPMSGVGIILFIIATAFVIAMCMMF